MVIPRRLKSPEAKLYCGWAVKGIELEIELRRRQLHWVFWLSWHHRKRIPREMKWKWVTRVKTKSEYRASEKNRQQSLWSEFLRHRRWCCLCLFAFGDFRADACWTLCHFVDSTRIVFGGVFQIGALLILCWIPAALVDLNLRKYLPESLWKYFCHSTFQKLELYELWSHRCSTSHHIDLD